MESEAFKPHESLQRAIDIALWMTFKYRMQNRNYVIIQDKKTKQYQVVTKERRRKGSYIATPADYSQMSYAHIQAIRSEFEPLDHWEEIVGLFCATHGEILRFILHYQVPLEKIIRYELASRGYDKNHQWIGFDKARAIWLTPIDNANENRP
jgi:hypothetical protein